MAAFASTTTTVTFTDLNPGDKLGLSIDFHYGTGGSSELDEGFSDQTVQADGTIRFAGLSHDISQGHQGTANAWVRPSGSDQDADPVDYVSGPDAGKPARFTFHLP